MDSYYKLKPAGTPHLAYATYYVVIPARGWLSDPDLVLSH